MNQILWLLVLGVIAGCTAAGVSEESRPGTAQVQPAPADPGLGEATLTWEASRTRTDQSCLADLEGFLIRWGTSPDHLVRTTRVPLADLHCTGTGRKTPCSEIRQCTFTIEELRPATWYFVVYAYDSELRLSEPSEVARKTIEPRR